MVNDKRSIASAVLFCIDVGGEDAPPSLPHAVHAGNKGLGQCGKEASSANSEQPDKITQTLLIACYCVSVIKIIRLKQARLYCIPYTAYKLNIT